MTLPGPIRKVLAVLVAVLRLPDTVTRVEVLEEGFGAVASDLDQFDERLEEAQALARELNTDGGVDVDTWAQERGL